MELMLVTFVVLWAVIALSIKAIKFVCDFYDNGSDYWQ